MTSRKRAMRSEPFLSRGGRRRNRRREGAVRFDLRRVTERHCDVGGDRSDRASRCWLVPSRATTNLEVLMTKF